MSKDAFVVTSFVIFCSGVFLGWFLRGELHPQQIIVESAPPIANMLVGGTTVTNNILRTEIAHAESGTKLAELKVDFVAKNIMISLDPLAQVVFQHVEYQKQIALENTQENKITD